MSGVPHKAGPLKQQNKPHKHGRHKTKGQLGSIAKGRVSVKVLTQKVWREKRKADRRNQMRQLRSNKRHETMNAKRTIGVEGSPPHCIVVVPLSSSVDCQQLHTLLCGACDETVTPPFTALSTIVSPGLKQRFTLVFPPPSNPYTLLDVAKVADTLLLVYRAGVELDSYGQLCLDCCCSQGLPSTFHVIQGLKELPGKSASSVRKAVQKQVDKRFPEERAHSLDSSQDAVNVLRYISGQKRRKVSCRDQRPHILVEHMQFTAKDDGVDYGTLKVSGYVRGRALSVNGLVHLPGAGDFQMEQIDSPSDPHRMKPRREGDVEVVRVLEVADPVKQESLDSEVVPDPMEGEQTWPSLEELRQAEASLKEKRVKRVPCGMSEYQASWIVDSESEGVGDSDSEDDDVPPPDSLSEGSDDEGMSVAESDTTTTMDVGTDQYDGQMDLESEQKQLELFRAEKEEHMFPDELDTPLHIKAKDRFQKYRGLGSFRKSPWDPKENLPQDYARIFQFENFAQTKKRVLTREVDNGALPGWYVTVHISNVPRGFVESCDLPLSPVVVFGLLQHENKMSVIHYVLKRSTNFSLPLRSKDRLIFHCGVRRFSACPIFSQHTAGDKHKYERFFPRDGVCVASVFAPISYPPQPTLVFKQEQDTHVLVASGSLYKADTDRVVCKRIVLSGHPFQIHKKSAVIRYMFFNREDIVWFKPVELRTRCGRRGHIREPLGTHGHMKCTFDGPLKAQDTILMNLYKRVYPKWTYTPQVTQPSHWGDGTQETDEEMATTS